MSPRLLAGRYELTEPLGRGGMGEVWAGSDTALGGRRIAVKLLHAERLASLSGTTDPEELRRRFLRECRATARIDHPGLVAVYDAGAEADELFLVMQLVDGCGLADHLAEHGEHTPYPVAWALAVLAQLSSVLVAVHAAGIVHRDLKPGNVMVRPDGRVTVLDLGIAAVRGDEDTSLTRTGTLIGTPVYMAPEQGVGEPPVGPRADLYALGAIGYELLTGRPPFTAPNAAGLLYKKLHHDPAALRSLRPDAPGELAALVHRLLARDPADRPADAHQTYAELIALLPRHGLAGPATGPAPDTPLDPARPFRHPMAPWPPAARSRPPAPSRPATPQPGTGTPATTGGHGYPDPRTPAGGIRGAGPTLSATLDEVKRLLAEGQYARVADLLSSALPMAAARYGETSAVVRSLRKQYAATLLDTGQFARALPEIRRLIQEFTAERGPYDPVVAQLRQDEQHCLRHLGSYA
ncbi:serine/threonine-protein kinase [Streptomyces sp. YIM 98790]|uniref:serine/threonine-protein kinase n=1 Tax=Streptomyces sp. YIM 98790 TaxID=2689077 RepID=UPI00140AD28F|nr:serine/threonine-protein kinase [Streptomyces sp. YIM 98790]